VNESIVSLLHSLEKCPNEVGCWLALADALEECGLDGNAELARLSVGLWQGDTTHQTRAWLLLQQGVSPTLPQRQYQVRGGLFRFNMIPAPDGPFWMMTSPISNGQWLAVAGEPWWGRQEVGYTLDPRDFFRSSWGSFDQFRVAFERVTGANVRLPREEEWEYACLGGPSPDEIEPQAWLDLRQDVSRNKETTNTFGMVGMIDGVGWECCENPWREGPPPVVTWTPWVTKKAAPGSSFPLQDLGGAHTSAGGAIVLPHASYTGRASEVIMGKHDPRNLYWTEGRLGDQAGNGGKMGARVWWRTALHNHGGEHGNEVLLRLVLTDVR
jgi:hypothetical protein